MNFETRELSKQRFIETYVANFLAAYAAQHYDSNCQNGWVNPHQPVDDARLLAEDAYRQLIKRLARTKAY